LKEIQTILAIMYLRKAKNCSNSDLRGK